MSDTLRIVVDGTLIFEGEVQKDSIMCATENYVKPKMKNLSAAEYFVSNAPLAATYDIENFTMITVSARSPNKGDALQSDPWVDPPTVAVEPPPTDDEIADALEAAADLFLTEGWAQGALKMTPKMIADYEEGKIT